MAQISRLLALATVVILLQVQGEKTFQGALIKVDVDMHVLTVRGADEQELYFTYSEDTKVVGPAKDAQSPGATLKITYHVEGSSNVATRIEVLP
jgi:hypothetical protein